MNNELQIKLVTKYPKMFPNFMGDPMESPLAFGFECGDGWYNIINMLCWKLQSGTDRSKDPQIEVQQVKEKFGGLRFYVGGGTKEQYATISFAECLCDITCMTCGTMNNVGYTRGWIITLCENCLNEMNKGQKFPREWVSFEEAEKEAKKEKEGKEEKS